MIELWVISFSLILTRVGTFVMTMPLFGGKDVPRMVKVGLASALAVFYFGQHQGPTGQAAEALSTGWLPLGIALGGEGILGAMLGFAMGLVLVPMRVAGEFIGQEMGLAIAPMIDPTAENPSAVITQIFEMLGVLLFFGLDGHHVFFAALQAGFQRWPIGQLAGPLPVEQLVRGSSMTQEWGVLVAAPILLCLFLTSVVMALLARAVPQFNIFSLGAVMRLGIGLVSALILLPGLLMGWAGVVTRWSQWFSGLV